VHGEIEIMSTKSFINKDKYQYIDSSLQHAQNYTHTCLMVLHTNVKQSPGSHFAVVDSGILIHILQYRLFTSNLSEDHTAVSGFSGNTSRATHRGNFNCVVRAQNGRLIHLVDPSAALVIPDSHRNLYSVRHAQISGHTVILGAQAGLLPYGDPNLFVPFLEDKSTGLCLYCHHRSHTMVSIQSITLNHHQDTLKEMTTKIRIKASSTAAQNYHFPWNLTTVSQQQLHVLEHQRPSNKIELTF